MATYTSITLVEYLNSHDGTFHCHAQGCRELTLQKTKLAAGGDFEARRHVVPVITDESQADLELRKIVERVRIDLHAFWNADFITKAEWPGYDDSLTFEANAEAHYRETAGYGVEVFPCAARAIAKATRSPLLTEIVESFERLER